tara:strand:+ start:94 stop:555 length:462 start_codon:yes stop_codon:yes gene_type:complete
MIQHATHKSKQEKKEEFLDVDSRYLEGLEPLHSVKFHLQADPVAGLQHHILPEHIQLKSRVVAVTAQVLFRVSMYNVKMIQIVRLVVVLVNVQEDSVQYNAIQMQSQESLVHVHKNVTVRVHPDRKKIVIFLVLVPLENLSVRQEEIRVYHHL